MLLLGTGRRFVGDRPTLLSVTRPRYDIGWWREYWKRTAIQGVIINAGGIVAYYPSKFPLQHRAEFLNGRDLYGELVAVARQDGLAVVARMDSNRTSEDFYQAHQDWFARKLSGEVYRAADKFVTCVNRRLLSTISSECTQRDYRAKSSRWLCR